MIRFPILALLVLSHCATTGAGAPAEYRAAFTYPNTIDVGEVEEDGMVEAFSRFSRLASSGERRVTLRIDSPGGSIFLGNRWGRAMEDVKKRNGVTVTCVVDGMAASMAAVILESPLCDVRLATPRSMLLFHNGSVAIHGTAEEIKRATAFLEVINEAMALSVSSRLGMALAEYQAHIALADWVLAGPEALAVHALDGIVSPAEIAPPVAQL